MQTGLKRSIISTRALGKFLFTIEYQLGGSFSLFCVSRLAVFAVNCQLETEIDRTMILCDINHL